MINPDSLRLRVKEYYRGHRIKSRVPSLTECEVVIRVVAQATNSTPEELCRKIEHSDIAVTALPYYDHRQMSLFHEPELIR